ncbi:MAG: flagellar basal body P-ring formation chaperone FlgA [Gemmatimonadales bacterium]
MISFAELLLSASVLAAGAPADTTVPEAFAARVRAAVAARWSAAPERLRLEWGLIASRSRLDSTTAVRVAGEGADGWLVVVAERIGGAPLAIRVHAGMLDSMVVTARALEPGHVIASDDIVTEQRMRWGPAPKSPITAIVGWEIRRSVRAGEPLLGLMLQAPKMIAPGDAVTLRWHRGAVELEVEAVALTAARLGEVVYARAGSSRLAGTVTGPNAARLEEKGQ